MTLPSYRLFDSHAHAHFNAFRADSDQVIGRALESGVGMVLVGTQRDTSAAAVAAASRYENVWAAIGLHPIHTTEGYFDPNEEAEPLPVTPFRRRAEVFDPTWYRALAASSPKVVAIGEVGLDYYRLEGTASEKDAVRNTQQQVFAAEIALASELKLPLCIHCREAHDDVYRMLIAARREHPELRAVIHCFTGTVDEADRYLRAGFLISFSGIITFAKDWDEFIRTAPLDHLLIETDCPYLTPVPYRGRRNEPAYLVKTAERMATIRGVGFDDIAQATTTNARKFFALS